ncbi:hypothetical protein HJFPF1_09779 [Paramyrothecium foliicola]|nr:hypothetical protein HJFPF1_09779 [Paramyrothecium foliicola]
MLKFYVQKTQLFGWIWKKEEVDADISGGAGGVSRVHGHPTRNAYQLLDGLDADSHIYYLQATSPGDDPVDIMRYSRVRQTSDITDREREDGTWVMVGDCYLYGFDAYALLEDDQVVVDEFVIL